ncbi:hypothetical protein BMR1_01G00725 [Babesia microti strain RI]|uniref:Uncharacterized protein n=1 Tax=Babesia microti (strain RI) TaxID=1133968 RepID=I7J826_BABMR|nr:hypothetical protein BMR1_01G00725 [Babesia microti strain RI]CCF72609.1 hypothetical protein BMR1_01G00725 [Babesia microti strain RI]|eukprot:XP_012647218.1 hypothetical protein BMR1_01G00725 [Babesia microti strain RI]
MSSKIGDKANNDSSQNGNNSSTIFNNIFNNTTTSDILPTTTGPPNSNIDNPSANFLRPSGMVVGINDQVFRQTGIQKPTLPMKFDPIGPFGVDPDEDVLPSLNTSQFNPIEPFTTAEQFHSIGAEESIIDNFGRRGGQNPKGSSMNHPFNYSGRSPNLGGGFAPRHFPF